jgi:hypothetical protein
MLSAFRGGDIYMLCSHARALLRSCRRKIEMSVSLRRAPRAGRIKQRRRSLETSSNARAGADATWQPGDR